MLKYRLDPDWYAYMPNDAERRTTATAEVDQMIANLETRGGQTVSTATAATGDAANMPATQAAPKSYATEAEAEAALARGEIKSKDIILIAGRRAEVP